MEPGYRIENYVVIEKIGQGGQAAVWSAYDERLRRTVAIKTISLGGGEGASTTGTGTGSGTGTAPANASSLTNPESFRAEAQIIARLEHPNILPVYAFGQDGDMLYIVMRYMASGSLKDLLKKEPLSPQRVVTLMEPLAGALDLAHRNEVTHRDIKSANVLLDAQLHPYLADFGLSVTKGDKAEAGVGTLAYMSPQQLMGEQADFRSDLYSFGILMYELIVGQLPGADKGQPWNLSQTMNNDPMPLPSNIPSEVADVLRKATAFSADERYQTAQDAVDALHDAVMGQLPVAIAQAAPIPEVTDPAMLALIEAQDLFFKAQERWSDGAGRFRFEAGDFKYVDSYYTDPEAWNLELNEIVDRLMLRGALEHGYNIDHWWNAIRDLDDRRAVTLQTLTSDLAPARLRAIERLGLLEDSTPPAIPIRVASVIENDPSPEVRLAGVALLEQRGMPDKPKRANAWRPFGHSETIDAVLVNLAANDSDPRVAEAAARACARLRSAFAVERLGRRAADGSAGAFRALTFVRDEAPALPPRVPGAVRSRVFLTLSRRQLLANPLQLIMRYVGAFVGAAVVMGAFAFQGYNSQGGLLGAQQVGNALAVGALYGILIGLGIFAASEIAGRLRCWNRPGRIVLAWVIGAFLTWVAFNVFDRYFNFYTPQWQWLLLWSLVFVAGFALSAGLTQWPTLRSLAGAISVLLALYFSWQNGKEPLLYFGDDINDPFGLYFSAFAGAVLGVFIFLPEWLRALRRTLQSSQRESEPSKSG